jgi:hypothetical protein
MKRIRKFLGLSRKEKRLLLRAWWLLARMSVLTRCMSFAALQRRVQDVKPRREVGPFAADFLVWAVEAAGRFVPGVACLQKALVASILLPEHGYPVTLRIGVQKTPAGELRAHAWVESSGRILIGGPNIADFTPLYN